MFTVTVDVGAASPSGEDRTVKAPTLAVYPGQKGTIMISSGEGGNTYFQTTIIVSPKGNESVWVDLEITEIKNEQVVRSTKRGELLKLDALQVFE